MDNLEGETSAASRFQHCLPSLSLPQSRTTRTLNCWKRCEISLPPFWRAAGTTQSSVTQSSPSSSCSLLGERHILGLCENTESLWHREGNPDPNPALQGSTNSLKKLLINLATKHLPPLMGFPNLKRHNSSTHHHWSLCCKILESSLKLYFLRQNEFTMACFASNTYPGRSTHGNRTHMKRMSVAICPNNFGSSWGGNTFYFLHTLYLANITDLRNTPQVYNVVGNMLSVLLLGQGFPNKSPPIHHQWPPQQSFMCLFNSSFSFFPLPVKG